MNKRLLVPVYLNQRIVFDLLAMLQGGISTVTAVTSATEDTDSVKRGMGTSFGLSNALSSLLKIDLSASRDAETNKRETGSRSEERVHTPASLLYQLRNHLLQEEMFSEIDEINEVQTGDIIEFDATLQKNPLIATLEGLAQIFEIAIALESKPASQMVPKKSMAAKSTESSNQKAQIEGFISQLKSGNTLDLITPVGFSSAEAVITLEKSFLNDPLMSDLVDGNFKVIGKVIRKITSAEDSISLLRNNALNLLPDELLDNVAVLIKGLQVQHGIAIPDIRWQIPGPAIQVLPIAIYA